MVKTGNGNDPAQGSGVYTKVLLNIQGDKSHSACNQTYHKRSGPFWYGKIP